MQRRPASPQDPILGVFMAVVFFGMALFSARDEIRVHLHGHRVMGRIASVSHGRGGSSTRVTFSVGEGEPGECTVSGDRGNVGGPLWMRYLPDDPSVCSSDDMTGFRRPMYLALLGLLFAAVGARFFARGRSSAGDPPPGSPAPRA
jgi:hypothetical protein